MLLLGPPSEQAATGLLVTLAVLLEPFGSYGLRVGLGVPLTPVMSPALLLRPVSPDVHVQQPSSHSIFELFTLPLATCRITMPVSGILAVRVAAALAAAQPTKLLSVLASFK